MPRDTGEPPVFEKLKRKDAKEPRRGITQNQRVRINNVERRPRHHITVDDAEVALPSRVIPVAMNPGSIGGGERRFARRDARAPIVESPATWTSTSCPCRSPP
jgi:hypothetical protein